MTQKPLKQSFLRNTQIFCLAKRASLSFHYFSFQQVRKTSTGGPVPVVPAPAAKATSPPASPGGQASAKAKKLRKDSATSGAGKNWKSQI